MELPYYSAKFLNLWMQSDSACMANQLNRRHGEALHTKDLTLVDDAYRVDVLQVGDKEYTASYFSRTDSIRFQSC